MPQSNEVEKLQLEIKWIEDSIKGKTPINDVLASKSPKTDIIRVWAEKLERLAKLGVYQKPISTISTHITGRLREMGLDSVASNVRNVLNSKYKDSSKITRSSELESCAVEQHEISSKKIIHDEITHTELESEYMKLLTLERDCIDKIILKFREKNFLKDVSQKDLKILEECFLKLEAVTVSTLQIIDERNNVPFMKQFLFFYARTQTTLGSTYTLFVKYLRDFAKLTDKQAGKIADGRISRVQLIFEPKNRLEAMNVGFYGIPCDECGSYRIKPKIHPDSNDDKLFCFSCSTWQELRTEKLPLSD